MQRRLVFEIAIMLGLAVVLTNMPGVDALGWPRDVFRAILWAVTLFVVARKLDDRTAIAALGVIASFALASHVHFGRFHGEGRVLHHHELFNYSIGSKYFPELGYDGHYLATHRALLENDPTLDTEIAFVKNLRTYQLEGREVSKARSESVAARFTDQRWSEFRADIAFFQSVVPRETWGYLMVDHGYNATPFWTLLGRSLSNKLDLSSSTLSFFASLDVVLALAMVLLVRWAFDTRTSLLFAIFFLASFFGTFEFTGGAFLRQVWLLGLVGFVCCWKRGHAAAAGLFLAVATLDRIFPVLFVLAPLAAWARHVALERNLRHSSTALLGVFGGALVVLGFASGGIGVWTECYANLTSHSHWFFLNQISLRTLLIIDPVASSDLIASGWDEAVWLRQREALDAATSGTLLALRLGLGILLVAAVTGRIASRKGPESALALLAFAPFVLLYPANYYFTFLVLVVLAWRSERPLALTVIGLQVVFWLLSVAFPPPLSLELLNWGVSLLLLLALAGHLLAAVRVPRLRLAAGIAVVLVVGIGAASDAIRTPIEGPLDLVASDVTTSGGSNAENQQMAEWGSAWSQNDHVSILAQRVGGRAELHLPTVDAGTYNVRLELTTAPPYGIVEISVNGRVLMSPLDLFSPRLALRAVVLKDVPLTGGNDRVAIEVIGKNPASTGHHLGIDRVFVLPARLPMHEEVRDQALNWIIAHPADLFDGGRRDVGAEIAALALAAGDPLMEELKGTLEQEVRRRLAFLDASATGRVFPSESESLVVAALEAQRLGLGPGFFEGMDAEIRALASATYDPSAIYRPLALCVYLQRLDNSPAGACALDGGALASSARSLLTLTGGSVDRRRVPEFAKLTADATREIFALTDLGREAPPPELAGALWTDLLDQGLGFGLEVGDALAVARILLATVCLGVEPEVDRFDEGINMLRATQLPDGSFGAASPVSPNPSRELVLTAAVLFTLAS